MILDTAHCCWNLCWHAIVHTLLPVLKSKCSACRFLNGVSVEDRLCSCSEGRGAIVHCAADRCCEPQQMELDRLRLALEVDMLGWRLPTMHLDRFPPKVGIKKALSSKLSLNEFSAVSRMPIRKLEIACASLTQKLCELIAAWWFYSRKIVVASSDRIEMAGLSKKSKKVQPLR